MKHLISVPVSSFLQKKCLHALRNYGCNEVNASKNSILRTQRMTVFLLAVVLFRGSSKMTQELHMP